MTVTEILQFVDHLVFTKTDKHLDDLQKKIIKEVFQGKTYKEIADFYDYDEGYIGDESRKIFKVLSEKLGEDINKNNFCWTLERVINSQLVNIVNGNLNLCPNHQFLNQETIKKNQRETNYYDLTLAPKIIKFYDRETELKKLNNYIFKQNIALISVLGLTGIGKTTLVKRFVDLNLEKFEVIMWKSFKFPKSLDLLVNDLLKISNVETFHETSLQKNEVSLQKSFDDKLIQLFAIFKEKRCLIIFDDVQELFIKGNLAGQYQDQYKNYQSLFNLIKEIDHQSHVILISDEQCQAMVSLDEKLLSIKSLELGGLTNTEFLTNFNLKEEESWLTLINLYEGNYNYLRDIAYLIKDIFGGKVTDFLAENELILIEDIKVSLTELFNKLSPIEREIVLKLSQYDPPITKQELKQNLNLSLTDLINGLQSLNRRFLIKYQDQEKLLFSLTPVFKRHLQKSS